MVEITISGHLFLPQNNVINVPQESFSMGVTDFRDGVNLSKVEKTEPLILPSELQNLPDLTGFVKFVGHDLVKVKLNYKKFLNKNTAFEERRGYTLNQQFNNDSGLDFYEKDVVDYKKQVRQMRKTESIESGIPQESEQEHDEILNEQSQPEPDHAGNELEHEQPETESPVKKKLLKMNLIKKKQKDQEKAEAEKNKVAQRAAIASEDREVTIDAVAMDAM